MQSLTLIAASGVGILVQEVVQWYSLRSVLSKREHQQTLRDPTYWIVVIAMLVVGTAATYFWMADELDRYKIRDALILGISFPAIVRKTLSAATPDNKDPALGVRWTTYLR
jgi:uncharacterized membrane-anchored protein